MWFTEGILRYSAPVVCLDWACNWKLSTGPQLAVSSDSLPGDIGKKSGRK